MSKNPINIAGKELGEFARNVQKNLKNAPPVNDEYFNEFAEASDKRKANEKLIDEEWAKVLSEIDGSVCPGCGSTKIELDYDKGWVFRGGGGFRHHIIACPFCSTELPTRDMVEIRVRQQATEIKEGDNCPGCGEENVLYDRHDGWEIYASNGYNAAVKPAAFCHTCGLKLPVPEDNHRSPACGRS